MEVLDEQEDVGSGVASSDTDVSELAGDAQGHAAGLIDLVLADAVVGVAAPVGAGGGLGQGRVDRCWGGAVGQAAVRSLLVVDQGELIQECLQLGEGGGLLGLGA